MKITIESTSQIMTINGVRCRIWEGETESGIKVNCIIPRIAVYENSDQTQFDKELQEVKPPSKEALEAFPLKMII